MNARLGFSIAVHLEPDVLIIDEVLSVGDIEFQTRAFDRIHQLANSGLPVVIVSHQLDKIAELCDSLHAVAERSDRVRRSAGRGDRGLLNSLRPTSAARSSACGDPDRRVAARLGEEVTSGKTVG